MNRSVLWKTWITAIKIKVTAKVQSVSECLSGYRLNRRTFCNLTCMVVQHHEPECHAGKKRVI